MKTYQPKDIKNIAIVGHGNAGKTSLAEAMLFAAGASERLGKTSEGNTILDFDPEEIKRHVSINLSMAPIEYENTKINILDTPGSFDFAAGVYEGIAAAASVVIAISGKSGVTPGAEITFNLAKQNNKSRMFFVTKMDNENADFYKVLEDLKANFGPAVCPLVVPVVENRKVVCYINLIENKAYAYENGKAQEVPVPDTGHRLEGLMAAISEAVAETDEALFEKYFSGEQFTTQELIDGIHKGVKEGAITPVFCGSAYNLEAIDLFLKAIHVLFPSAEESCRRDATDKDGSSISIECDIAAPASAFVFKTVADPFTGKISYLKVMSGTLTSDMQLVNARNGENEKLGKLFLLKGKKQEEIKEVCAGDICAVAKLSSASTGDTLCSPSRVISFAPIAYPYPCMSMAISPRSKGDESKISGGLQRLIEEDPTLNYEQNIETHQQIISGLGDQHLEVALSKLKQKFGVDAVLETPIVPYRESIRKKVRVEGKHKKQTGGHGQFGHVWIEFEPCDSEDLVFEEKVFGGAVPKGFFPAVEKGLRESILHGPIAGYPLVGLKATLVDGSYHPVDSSEMSFKMAANLAYKAGMPQASPILLEPIGTLKATIPDSYTGDLMGEINKRRGRVLGMNPVSSSIQEIEAEVPVSEMHDFTTVLRSMTQGRGVFTFTFTRYEPLPSQLEKEVIEKAPKREEKA